MCYLLTHWLSSVHLTNVRYALLVNERRFSTYLYELKVLVIPTLAVKRCSVLVLSLCLKLPAIRLLKESNHLHLTPPPLRHIDRLFSWPVLHWHFHAFCDAFNIFFKLPITIFNHLVDALCWPSQCPHLID